MQIQVQQLPTGAAFGYRGQAAQGLLAPVSVRASKGSLAKEEK